MRRNEGHTRKRLKPCDLFNNFPLRQPREYKEKGIDFQLQAPLYVATKMSKIRSASLTAPSPKTYAAAGLKAIGYGAMEGFNDLILTWFFFCRKTEFKDFVRTVTVATKIKIYMCFMLLSPWDAFPLAEARSTPYWIHDIM